MEICVMYKNVKDSQASVPIIIPSCSLHLKEELKNNISAFSGNSGVGKSTLLNNIFKDTITQEGDISKKNQKGKNTTTKINLYKLGKNEYIADTPRIFNI